MKSQAECLACGSNHLWEILDLGDQHPVNSISHTPVACTRYPLRLMACEECGHAQQFHLVPPSELFTDYFYASSTSMSLDRYSLTFAEVLAKVLEPGLRVLEIASNDGILLKHLVAVGYRATGIDPASRMVRRAVAKGLDTIEGFWPDAAVQLGGEQFDLVIGQNVLAHTPKPADFLAGVTDVLTADGLAVFQTSQADMVYRNEFDTIYHEHYSFFCERSATAVGARAGLTLLETVYTPIHGTSAIFIYGKGEQAQERASALREAFERQFPDSNTDVLPAAAALRTARPLSEWRTFGAAANTVIQQLAETAREIQSTGGRVVAVGASAKGITALRAAQIDPDALLDEAEDKIGMFVDGFTMPISGLDNPLVKENCVFFLTAWNFSRELSQKLLAVGVAANSDAVLFFPKVHRVTVASLAALA